MVSNLTLGTFAISIATVAVALIVAVITYYQYRTDRLRLRHELFERRFEIFKAAQTYLSAIMREGRLDDDTFSEQYPKFVDAYQRSLFLFGKEIPDYLEEIRRRSTKLRFFEQTKKHEEAHDEVTWLTDETPELFKRFGPYLTFPIK